MDDIKLKRTNTRALLASRAAAKRMGRLTVKSLEMTKPKKSLMFRLYSGFIAILIIATVLIAAFQPFINEKPHQLSQGAIDLLPKTSKKFSELLKYDQSKNSFEYNSSYSPEQDSDVKAENTGSPRIVASLSKDPQKGMIVKDPINDLDFQLIPKFRLQEGKQQENQVFYKLKQNLGYLVYTSQATGVKEDIVLEKYNRDRVEYEYEIKLEDGLETKLEKDGSIGVYGSELPLNGDVATGSDKDAALLQKAREKADKTKLLFTIPAPVVKETNKTASQVKIHYELNGNNLKVVAENMKTASYPLSIDPSVYVETAQKFMRGNNESNVDFDVTNELIQKGVVTGARIPSWTGTTSLPADRWNHGTVVAGGYVYVIGGNSGSTRVSNVYWAKFDPSNYTLTAPNPGAGACTNWCTGTAYDLPAARDSMSVAAYNGYLYVMGGKDSGGARSTNVYYAKIGANGEPISWTLDSSSALSTERSHSSAIAYNNRMYLMGGQTNAATGGVTTVEYADINPDGSLGAWSTTGMTALASARWGHSSAQYNGYLYVVGGANGTTAQTGVSYIKITSTGSLASSWVTTTALPSARMTFGGSFATIWGGYMYVTGGCSALTATNCSTVIASDTLKLASINADGSITDWTSVSGVTTTKVGYGLVGWRNTIYQIGGCSGMTTDNCTNSTTTLETTFYGRINNDGDIGPIETENSQPTIGAGAGQVGRTAMGVVINNGYIYNIGGCANNGCTTMSDNTGYAPINADGSIGSWTVDSTDTLNGTTGIGAAGVSVYNNYVYVVGGANGTDYVRNIFRASFNSDGSLGSWTNQADVLPDVDTGAPVNGYGHMYVITRSNSATAGNLYIIGGCWTGGTGIGCSNYISTVYKCDIAHSDGATSSCAITNQLQLTEGLGLMAGIYYAGYIYLAGGANESGDAQTRTVFFATINSSGNIVRADNGNATGGWDTTSDLGGSLRRRGVAVGVNGYIYVIGGHDGSGPSTLSDIQYAKIDQTTGELNTFTTSTVTITARWNEGAAAANGYIYIVGGCTSGAPPGSCSAQSGVNEKVQVYNNYSASPASFTSSGNTFATDRYAAASAVHNGYLYIAGGCTTGTDCTTATDNTQFALLNDDGTVGTWANTTDSTLPAVRAHGQMEVVGGTLYFIGGQTSGSTAGVTDVYYGTPASNGDISTWASATNGLPAGRTMHSSTVWNNRIYVTGGNDGSSAASNVIYASPSLSSGGDIGSAWTSTGMTAFTTARSGHVAIAYGSFLYILGGFDGTNYLLDAQYAAIASDGTIGSWSATEKLPQRIRQGDGFASNGFLYIFGGRSASTTCTNNTYVIPINANGSLGYWSQTNVRFTTARYAPTVAYNGGRAYMLGGYDCTGAAFTGANRVVHATLQFQPHIANYSLAIDADTDVFPSMFVANGLDNADGARWYLNYKSATSGAGSSCASMTTWGQNTNAGAVSLGVPSTYTPKDGSGSNTSCARYFFLNLTIDSQNAWGFPEDVSRGPTITDLSFVFTSDPGKRLIHGKTFIGGQQQPLDTPCRQSNYPNCPLP
ncbi:hypothetical protein HZB74_00710 [Candidatus Saccharibacteria bacterium]|nr:hypothetical protein [Candidatus Saccharibacteria bacterium]